MLTLPPIVDVEAFHQRITQAAADYGVLRVKGYVRVAGKPMRYLVQAVGVRISGHFDGVASGNEGRIVVIGRKGFDIDAVRGALEGVPLASVG